jgi:pimeloyl-ACP methyl ester carboxylesterase
MKKTLMLLAAGVLVSEGVFAQRALVVPWANEDPNNPSPAYRPEPILFVHGINANDEGWQTAIDALRPSMSNYQRPLSSPPQTVGGSVVTRAAQTYYLHTFNYGDPPGTETHDRQSFDHIEWNAWENDLHTRTFTNVYLKPTDSNYIHPARPTDQRRTLDKRISDVRSAYASDPLDPSTWPNVVLVAHSMGGLLSHYYLIKSAEMGETGVRRLVTVATPHQGSHVANWVLWDKSAGMATRIFDSYRHHFPLAMLSLAGRPSISGGFGASAGYMLYPHNGAVEDLSVLRREGPANLRHVNDLMDYFWTNSAPKLEYVFNVYKLGAVSIYYAQRISASDPGLAGEQLLGDGVVAQWSAAGKPLSSAPSIWNGWDNPSGNHDIDPVIFGTWENTDHSAAPKHTESIIKSLDGVPHVWPGPPARPPSNVAIPPTYARTYEENQSFGKYLPLVEGTQAHTDEPGIGTLITLFNGPQPNAKVIPALNTWVVADDATYGVRMLKKTRTNAVDFVGHQIVGNPGSSVAVWGLVGAKNRAEVPVGVFGTDYWAVDGNEYLPAAIGLRFASDLEPILKGLRSDR